MSKIVAVSAAYWGDVLPFASIGRELARRGHDVHLVVPDGFHDLLRNEPFTLHRLGTDFSPREVFEVHPDVYRRLRTKSGGVKAMRWTIQTYLFDRLREVYESTDPVARDADIVLSHPMTLNARISAEIHGIPWMTVHLFPMIIPSADTTLPPDRPHLPRPINRALWSVMRFSSNHFFPVAGGRSKINAFRASLGLPPERDPLTLDALSPHGVAVCQSPHYYPAASDWPSTFRMTGFVPWDGLDDAIPPEVEAYLDAGDPPVLVTLGTSGAAHGEAIFDLVAEALDTVGVRGLFLVGHPSKITGRLAGRPGVWPFVPLGPVLRRCRAVVHSGANGTNAATLRAGLPALVVPQAYFDQDWHARRVARLGLGVALGRRRRTLARVVHALERLLEDGSIASKAKAMGETLRAEDGTANACDYVEEVLAASAR
jgi:UDP:flavonoid glycosyltransferase YjiC (YdhE family)